MRRPRGSQTCDSGPMLKRVGVATDRAAGEFGAPGADARLPMPASAGPQATAKTDCKWTTTAAGGVRGRTGWLLAAAESTNSLESNCNGSTWRLPMASPQLATTRARVDNAVSQSLVAPANMTASRIAVARQATTGGGN